MVVINLNLVSYTKLNYWSLQTYWYPLQKICTKHYSDKKALTRMLVSREQGYGLGVPDQQDVAKGSTSSQSLFRRLNHHSLMVLNSTTTK